MGVRAVTIHHDQDPFFTSFAWRPGSCRRIRCARPTRCGAAQDNTEMEAFNCRFTAALAGETEVVA